MELRKHMGDVLSLPQTRHASEALKRDLVNVPPHTRNHLAQARFPQSCGLLDTVVLAKVGHQRWPGDAASPIVSHRAQLTHPRRKIRECVSQDAGMLNLNPEFLMVWDSRLRMNMSQF